MICIGLLPAGVVRRSRPDARRMRAPPVYSGRLRPERLAASDPEAGTRQLAYDGAAFRRGKRATGR